MDKTAQSCVFYLFYLFITFTEDFAKLILNGYLPFYKHV